MKKGINDLIVLFAISFFLLSLLFYTNDTSMTLAKDEEIQEKIKTDTKLPEIFENNEISKENTIKVQILSKKIEIKEKNLFQEKSKNIEDLSKNQLSIIAHAGGKLDNCTYLNNYDSVKNSYKKGVRLIELDISFTSDNVPIMLHSFDGFPTKFFGAKSDYRFSFDEFDKFKMFHDYTKLSLKTTIDYMFYEFKEMFLITDTKDDNKELLKQISENYPFMMSRIIPQVYNQDEYFYAKKLGFNNIIYTLYMSEDSDDEILDFCEKNRIFAITMPKNRVKNSTLANDLKSKNIRVYTHTVDLNEEYLELKDKGIAGIYTNVLF